MKHHRLPKKLLYGELSNVDQKSVKLEETQQLSCTGHLEKALPLPFLVLTAQYSLKHRSVSLAICTLTDAFLNHKVDQMVLINYDGQIRSPNMNIVAYFKAVVEDFSHYMRDSRYYLAEDAEKFSA